MKHEVFFLNGVLAGCPGCRWALVTGPCGLEECFGFSTKPTPKQIRKAKRSLGKFKRQSVVI